MATNKTEPSTEHGREPYYSPALREKYQLDSTNEKDATPASAHQPAKIEFIPNFDEFSAREAASKQRRTMGNNSLPMTLPEGWPQSVNTAMTWTGADFKDESRFVYHLSEAEKTEIRLALEHFRTQKIESINVGRANFPLPTLGRQLDLVRDQVYNGIGFRILRGLDVEPYTTDDLSTILKGVSSYIAPLVGVQGPSNCVLGHITSQERAETDQDLPFHTDLTGDVVATVTRECSDQGGVGTLASSNSVYNHIAATRPDLINVLAKPDWPFDTYDREPQYHRRALLFYHDGRIIFNFSRRVLVGHPRSPRTQGIPGLTEDQAEALDMVHYTAAAQQLQISMKRGDLRFIGNLGVLHGRQSYRDDHQEDSQGDQSQKSKRHLIRLWLHNEDMAGKLPPPLQLAWDRAYKDPSRARLWPPGPPKEGECQHCGGRGCSKCKGDDFPCD